ncbi:MAG: Trk family potassium uptake protein [Phycisphaerae bacterium]|nr:Trk family potassium uptake protein [Phycisphaerae bacterium]
MKIAYKSREVERFTIGVTVLTAIVTASTFVLLYGFEEVRFFAVRTLHIVQVAAFLAFLSEKLIRFVNSESKKEFFFANWFEIPLLLTLMVILFWAERWFVDGGAAIMGALGVYLVVQVVIKACRNCVQFAASGGNATMALISVFVILIMTGTGMLMLPRSHNLERMSFVDALFTSTSATCVTGLVVKDTGSDFTMMGQIVILALIQLGGLGIVIFGAVIALLLGQALSVRESVAMRDLLSAQTLGRISQMIAFIIIFTMFVEALGAVSLLSMWDDVPGVVEFGHERWFQSIFHSISAFCNAGFGLFDDSLVRYRDSLGVYTVIAPLIILGGFGFGVIYNLFQVFWDRLKRCFRKRLQPEALFDFAPPVRVRLQTKIVLSMSLILIVGGALAIMTLEHYSPKPDHDSRFKIALFQSITARTAGFNTVDIPGLSDANKLVLMALMFVGGSPGSSAGGIKTVTLTVLIMIVYATLRRRPQVEVFRRRVSPTVAGRAITVTVLFVAILLFTTLLLYITERNSGFGLVDIMFEAASALGTVGLTTGVTPTLTTAGKLIIIAVMLIGRLGPLTLLAAITFNLKPGVYEYPAEPVIVG